MNLLFLTWEHILPILCFLAVNPFFKTAPWVSRSEIMEPYIHGIYVYRSMLSGWICFLQIYVQRRTVIYAIRFGGKSEKVLYFLYPWILSFKIYAKSTNWLAGRGKRTVIQTEWNVGFLQDGRKTLRRSWALILHSHQHFIIQ